MGKNAGIFIILAVFVGVGSVRGEGFRHLTSREGLSHNRVRNAAKDGNGLMWFSTRTGVDRYDGSVFTHFELPSPDDRMVSRSTSVSVSPGNEVWASNSTGHLFLFDPVREQFNLKINLPDSLGRNLTLDKVIITDSADLFAMGYFGLAHYDLAADRVYPLVFDRHVTDLAAISESVYIFSCSRGLFTLDLHDRQKPRIEPVQTGMIHERVQSLCFDTASNTLYFGTFMGDVGKYYPSNGEVSIFYSSPSRLPVRSIRRKGKTLYVAIDGLMVFEVEKNTEQCVGHYVSTGREEKDLSSYNIYDIFIDGEKLLWLSTYSRGVNILDRGLPDFRLITGEDRNGNPLPKSSAVSLLEDSDGNLWIGTEDGVLVHKRSTGKWISLFRNDDRYGHNRIPALCEDPQGRVWAGSFSQGAFCINKETFMIESKLEDLIPLDRPGRYSNIFSIFTDSRDRIWFCGIFEELLCYDYRTKQHYKYSVPASTYIAEYKGEIILATSQGLYKYNKADDAFKPWPKEHNFRLFNAYINKLLVDGDNLWFSTDKGVVCYDMVREAVSYYNAENGIVSDIVYGIVPDRQGRVWISTDRGISSIKPETGQISNYTSSTGLRYDYFNARSSWATRDGTILFGSLQGVIAFDPRQVSIDAPEARLYLADLKLNYRSVRDSLSRFDLRDPVNELTRVLLPYDENTFTLEYHAVAYSDASRIGYRWMLEGYDQQWIDARERPVISYSNLSPGKYRLRIELLNHENGDRLDTRQLEIVIRHHPFLSLPAIIAYVLLFALVAVYLYRLINEHVQNRKLGQMIRYFSDTAHEIKTPVSLIIGPLSMLEKQVDFEPQERAMFETAIANSKKLLELVNRLLDFRKFDAASSRLVIREYDIFDFIDGCVNRYHPLAIQRNIVLSLTDHLINRLGWFDGAKMEVVIGNLLSNSLKYTPPGGTVSVTVSQDGHRWFVRVADTGIGISRNTKKHLFRHFYRGENAIDFGASGSGIGLMQTKMLVRLLRGKIMYASEQGKGSVFTLSFLYGNDHFRNRAQIVTNGPAFDGSSAKAADRTEETVPDGGSLPTILLVEDNEQLRRFIRDCIGSRYNLAEAENGEEALRLVDEVNPDLILTDILMPKMNGFQLTSHIKGQIETSHIPVLILTALNDKSQIVTGYEKGADDYLIKPFDPTILLMKIENSLQNRESVRKKLMRSLVEGASITLENDLDTLFINKLRNLLGKNIANSDYTINELCRDMALSRSSFYNKIKALTAKSPNEFIRIFRLNSAAEMLLRGSDNIGQVAISCGFCDEKYFSTIFKKQFGVSPSKYVVRESAGNTPDHTRSSLADDRQ